MDLPRARRKVDELVGVKNQIGVIFSVAQCEVVGVLNPNLIIVGANCIRPIMIQMHFPNWVQWHPIIRITGVFAG